jgi:hypothetical protein
LDINVAAQPNQAEDGRDEEGIPELESGSLEFSHIADYEDMPELMDEMSEEAMKEEICSRNFKSVFNFGSTTHVLQMDQGRGMIAWTVPKCSRRGQQWPSIGRSEKRKITL